MPFSSKKQHRWMRFAESQGKLPKGTAGKWAHHTSNLKKLPETTKKKKSILNLPTLIKSRLINNGGNK